MYDINDGQTSYLWHDILDVHWSSVDSVAEEDRVQTCMPLLTGFRVAELPAAELQLEMWSTL